MDKNIRPTEEEEKKENGLGAFIKRNKIRLSAAALALIVSCGAAVGIHIHNQKDDSNNPDSSIESLDPDHTPDTSHGIVVDGDVIGTVDPENPIVKPGEPEPSGDIEFEIPGNHEHTGNEEQDPDPVESHLFHTFAEWTNDGDSNGEVRICTECGYKETRNHSLKPIQTKYYTTTLHSEKENGEHYKVQTRTCSTCDYVWTNTVKENCTYGKVTYDDTYHYQSCTGCGQSFGLKHTLDAGKLNSDGSTTYSCTFEGCSYTKTVEQSNKPINPEEPAHRHSYKRTSVLEDLQNGQHKVSVYDVCSCGVKRLISSNIYDCSYGTPRTTYTNLGESGHSFTTTNTCTVCGHKDIHKGNESHHTTTTINSNGDTVITCNECSYRKVIEKEKPPIPIGHTHTLGTGITTYEDLGNGQHRTKTVRTCTASDCDHSSGWISTTYGNATNCTYGTPNTVYSNLGESGHSYTTTRTCTACNHKDITKGSEAHNTYTTTDSDGNTVIKCYDCSYSKTVQKPPVGHIHDYEEKTETVYAGNDQHTTTIYNVCKDPNCTGDDKKVQISQVSAYCTYGAPSTTYEVSESGHIIVTTRECSGCGHKDIQKSTSIAHSHTIDTGRVDANGDKIYACVCGHEKSISQSCTHTWGTPQTTYEQIDGTSHKIIITHVCTNCGTSEQVSETTAPCSHDITEVGLTKTDSCGTCGYVHSTHTHVRDVHTTEGDDTYCHYEEVVCADCGEILTPKHGTETHTWIDDGPQEGLYQPTVCTGCGKTSSRFVFPTLDPQEPEAPGTEQTEYVPPVQEGVNDQQENEKSELTNAEDNAGKITNAEGNGIPEDQQPEGEPSSQAEEEEIIEEEIVIAGKTFVYTPTRRYHY